MIKSKDDMLLPSQVVQHSHVGVGVVEVVGVGWVVLLCPVSRKWTVPVKNVVLRLGLVVYTVKTNNLPACKTNKQTNIQFTLMLVIRRVQIYQQVILTCSRKRCSSGWLAGSIVTSNRGMKIFSSISWKLASCFFVW